MDWTRRAARLVAALADAGVLDPRWREAFAHTPRHAFAPRFYREDGTLVEGDQPDQREEWLAAVYADSAGLCRDPAAAEG